MQTPLKLAIGLILATVGTTRADEPRPVPLTRPEMKQLIEDMKARKPRIPLPEPTEQEKARMGSRGGGYEGRLRALYLPGEEGRPAQARGVRPGTGVGPGGGAGFNGYGFGRDQDPRMTLDYPFKTEMFWIVSRTNNCQYCLGHQESKLLGAGLKEDEIAALDGDWNQFSPARRAAFAFARKLTYEPHRLDDADVDSLRPHYSDLQILEMTLSIAGNNAINRWKEGVGVPQSANGGGFGARRPEEANAPPRKPAAEGASAHSYMTPTSEKYLSAITRVAPLTLDEKTGKPTRRTVSRSPAAESRAEVEKKLEARHCGSPRLPLIADKEARALISSNLPDGPIPQWARLLANFPRDGVRLINSIRLAEEKGDLSPTLKTQVAWIIARQDRAWYATGQAKHRLIELGQSEDQIYSLDGDWSGFTPTQQALFTVAHKLAASPVVLTDADVDRAVKLAGPRDVVQLINYTTIRASFDRITEVAGLRPGE